MLISISAVFSSVLEPARISVRFRISAQDSFFISDSLSRTVRQAISSAVAARYSLMSCHELPTMPPAKDWMPGTRPLPEMMDSGAEYVLTADVALRIHYRTLDNIVLPAASVKIENDSSGEPFPFITVAGRYCYGALVTFTLFNVAQDRIVRTWRSRQIVESEREECDECMGIAIQSATKGIARDIRHNFSPILDVGYSPLLEMPLVYGPKGYQFGSAFANGAAIRFMPVRFLSIGFEYQRMHIEQTVQNEVFQELFGNNTAHFSASSDNFALLVAPGYAFMLNSRWINFIFPHAELAFAYNPAHLSAYLDTLSYKAPIHMFSGGIGVGSTFAFRKLPLFLDPMVRLTLGGGKLPQVTISDERLVTGKVNVSSRTFPLVLFMAGIRVGLFYDTNPLR